jgi:NAD(P)-dependent dehydrogenase (short-subunit alcohol dehydrogenase family)
MARVLITGCNRGIGLEFVRQCLQRGDHVVAACRDPGRAGALREMGAQNSALQIVQMDVSDQASMAAFAAGFRNEAIDILINNAGVYGPQSTRFGTVTSQDWMPVLQVNTVAPLLLTQLLIENLRLGRDKKLVYLTSKMGSLADNSSGGSYIYRSSKAALNQVVKSLSVDLGKHGFTAVVLHPGWVQTDMGGPNAQINTKTSVAGMLSFIAKLGPDHNGGFFNYDSSEISW